eukprot:scaffold5164_cov251-Prasinococcus_capsulatus_cf.AAC.1
MARLGAGGCLSRGLSGACINRGPLVHRDLGARRGGARRAALALAAQPPPQQAQPPAYTYDAAVDAPFTDPSLHMHL